MLLLLCATFESTVSYFIKTTPKIVVLLGSLMHRITMVLPVSSILIFLVWFGIFSEFGAKCECGWSFKMTLTAMNVGLESPPIHGCAAKNRCQIRDGCEMGSSQIAAERHGSLFTRYHPIHMHRVCHVNSKKTLFIDTHTTHTHTLRRRQ